MAADSSPSYLESLYSLDGKTALVTGGATGIGRIIAEGLVRAGADVVIASRKAKACEECAAVLNGLGARGSAFGIAGDISNESGVSALAEQIARRFPRLSILVNNARKTWAASEGPETSLVVFFSSADAAAAMLRAQFCPLTAGWESIRDRAYGGRSRRKGGPLSSASLIESARNQPMRIGVALKPLPKIRM